MHFIGASKPWHAQLGPGEEHTNKHLVYWWQIFHSDEVEGGLRDLGEPICLFGEGPADRRNRLRELFSQLGEDAVRRKRAEDEEREREAREHDETTWYHEGPDGLKRAREAIARYSLPRARARIERAKEEASRMTESARMAKNQEVTRKVKATDLQASQIADQRPVSWCSFAPDSRHLATGSWSGLCKIWAVPECREVGCCLTYLRPNLNRTIMGYLFHNR